VAFVHVPVPVSAELLDTLQPIRYAPGVPPDAVAPVEIVVQLAGSDGAVVEPLRKANTTLMSPVAVALNVPLVAVAETLPSREICAHAHDENSSTARAANVQRIEFAIGRTQGQSISPCKQRSD
jgi:hypothetical protein